MATNKIQKASRKRSRSNLSCQSITTTDLFNIQPLLCREVIPHDNFSVKASQITRVDALPVSSFVSIKNRMAAFYVKAQQVWKPFDAFMTRSPYAFGNENVIPVEKPYFSLYDLIDLFRLPASTSLSLSSREIITSRVQSWDDFIRVANEHEYDFYFETIQGDNPVYLAYKLNSRGRRIYSILYSLGYRIPLITSYRFLNFYANLHFDLLPLMSYMSILVNYYTPIKFKNFAFVNSLSYMVDPLPVHRTTGSIWSDTLVPYQNFGFYSSVIQILSSVYYGSDYFTDSLVQPFAQTSEMESGVSDPTIPNSNNVVDSIVVDEVRSPVVDLVEDSDKYFTQYLLTALRNCTTDSQLGALTLNDQVAAAMAKFGYSPEVADMVPFELKHENGHIFISPEVATAATDLAPLGYKAGTGTGTLSLKFNKSFSHYGNLIILGSVSPDYFYYQGVHREMLHTFKVDMPDPKFADAGYQAVGNLELFLDALAPLGEGEQYPFNYEGTFGFQHKFAESTYPKDSLGGDFCLNSRNNGLDAFHFGRNLIQQEVVNTMMFGRVTNWVLGVEWTKNQFDRIFGDTNPANDHFQQWTLFDIDARRDVAGRGDFSIGDDNDGVVEKVKGISNVNNN